MITPSQWVATCAAVAAVAIPNPASTGRRVAARATKERGGLARHSMACSGDPGHRDRVQKSLSLPTDATKAIGFRCRRARRITSSPPARS